jgi:flagellar basal body-associated protein FliL
LHRASLMQYRASIVMLDKARTEDNFFAYITAAIVVVLVIVFVIAWSVIRSNSTPAADISYAKFGPYQIETQHYSISATLSVQTTQGDSDWPGKNRKMLNTIFKTVLGQADVKIFKDPSGEQQLQDALKKACNTEMHTNAVQAVVITDFSFQTRDSR